MRASLLTVTLLLLTATPAFAQDHPEGPVNLLDPNVGLMFWTVLIFVVLLFVLWKFAFPAILGAVEERERALAAALAEAKRDREEAARLLAEHRTQLEAGRAEAQRFVAEGRAIGEKMRTDMLAEARREQQELLERARREIEGEKDRAIQELRREAVDLAIAGASKVIEKNLDDASNRKLVEQFLADVSPRVSRR